MRTAGAAATFVFTVAFWLAPGIGASEGAARKVPVAWKVSVARLLESAGSVFAPTAVASFQLPTVAMPLAFVVALVPVADPVPTAKVTEAPETGLPNWSVRCTAGAAATFVFTVAVWLSP